MKFKIAERARAADDNKVPKTQQISMEQAKELLKTDYSEAAKAQPIYRAIYNTNYTTPIIITPNPRKPRVSLNTSNYYTLIINNSPIWKGFPKRQVIATTSAQRMFNGYSGSKEDAFRMFPKNGAKIGICPDQDIWDSGMVNFNDVISDIASSLNIKEYLDFDMATYGGMVKFCDEIDKKKHNLKYTNLYKEFWVGVKKDIDKYLNNNVPFLEFIQKEWYNPKSLDFKWMPIANFKAGPNQEVWTDAPCLMIHYYSIGDKSEI